MKNKIKFLTALASLSFVAPIITTATSCSKKDYSRLAETIKQDTIAEFLNICPVYRPTFRTRKICDYLKNRITQLGLGDSIVEDEYRSQSGGVNSSGNLTFEIPATKGLEGKTKIILQAHMDMVCALKVDKQTGEPIQYDWEKNGVIPVQEGNYIHSKDWNTSLGADDGIGVATILALAKDRDMYTHGPIRCIITTDEEDSPPGVLSIKNEWLDAPFVVNLDWETQDGILTSCAGCSESKFEHGFKPETLPQDVTKYYKIDISGCGGGHSALEIGKNKVNPIILMAELIEYIMHAPGGSKDIYISSISAPGSFTSIPESASIIFATKIDSKIITDDCFNFQEYSKFTHPIEKGLTITVSDPIGTPDHFLSQQDSNRILEYITILPFGPISYDQTTGSIETSGNIGGVVGANSADPENNYFCLEYNDIWEHHQDQGPMRLTFGIQGRSSNPTHLGPDHKKEPLAGQGFFYYISIATWHVFEPTEEAFTADNYIVQEGWLPPWPYQSNKLIDTLVKASVENKVPMKPVHTLGWAEVGEFFNINSNTQMACIGCQIDDVHSNAEKIRISSIKSMIYNLVYLFDNIPTTYMKGDK